MVSVHFNIIVHFSSISQMNKITCNFQMLTNLVVHHKKYDDRYFAIRLPYLPLLPAG